MQRAALDSSKIHYQTIDVDGVQLFYRSAGPLGAPAMLLLHGFPTSSHMFRDLIPLLADRFRVIAPDYPGFGYSATPSIHDFTYTFDGLADVIERFTDAVGLERYTIYMQDFGGPVGLRLARRRPDRVDALIVQNANAYEEGITPDLRDIVLRAYRERTPAIGAALRQLFELPATLHQYRAGVRDPSRVNPDSWQHAQWGMDRPGNKDIQFALHSDYGSNVECYDDWHAYFRAHLPRTLIVWGEGDPIFASAGAYAYRNDLPAAELHMLDAGHFALETNAVEIATYIRAFLAY